LPTSYRRSILPAALAAACLLPAAASAQGPPPPTSTNGKPVRTVATGVTTPTAFAFTQSTVFAGSGPDESGQGAPTGLFTLAGGTATRVPGTPPIVFGLAWHGGRLYVSTGARIVAFGGWDGTRFASRRTIASPRQPFAGFNGLAFGPDGRLYAGVGFRVDYPKRDRSRYAQSVVRMSATGKNLRTVARGLRQPFQLTFVRGVRFPYVGVLGQETGRIPDDAIVVARPGQNYGYPRCHFGRPRTCRGFATPKILLAGHASPMGIGAIGRRLYVSLFGGLKGDGKPVVATVPARGGRPKALLQGFAAPVIALGVHRGTVYVGDLTGTVYAVEA
jgi:hypothetical protein